MTDFTGTLSRTVGPGGGEFARYARQRADISGWVDWKGEVYDKVMRQAIRAAARTTARHILGLAKGEAPKDQGDLISSGRVEAGRGGRSHARWFIRFGGRSRRGGRKIVLYALKWHRERPRGGFKRGGKTKFLSDPLRRVAQSSYLSRQIQRELTGRLHAAGLRRAA